MYYEEEVAQECYNRVSKVLTSLHNYEYEIIFINDGSKDKTLEILETIAENNKNVKVILCIWWIRLLNVLENRKTESYEIEIQKIFIDNNENNKSMLIKVTDEELLEKTGGIIQGMSGAPIIQNDKFIGAVTHVLVNDSTMGYAVFGDLMIKQMREVG